MVRYSTPCVKLRSSSKAGGATTMLCGRMPLWTTSHQRLKCSCPSSPAGRLRIIRVLRRPTASACARYQLTFHLDHSMRAGQFHTLTQTAQMQRAEKEWLGKFRDRVVKERAAIISFNWDRCWT